MNKRVSKQFRAIFKNRKDYRAFKKAYTRAPLDKRLETLKLARKIIETGSINTIRIDDAD